MRRWLKIIPFLLLGIGGMTLIVLDASKVISGDWIWPLRKVCRLLLVLSIPYALNNRMLERSAQGAEAPERRRPRFTRAQTVYMLSMIGYHGFDALLEYDVIQGKEWGFVMLALLFALTIPSCIFMYREAQRYAKAQTAESGSQFR